MSIDAVTERTKRDNFEIWSHLFDSNGYHTVNNDHCSLRPEWHVLMASTLQFFAVNKFHLRAIICIRFFYTATVVVHCAVVIVVVVVVIYVIMFQRIDDGVDSTARMVMVRMVECEMPSLETHNYTYLPSILRVNLTASLVSKCTRAHMCESNPIKRFITIQ